MIKVMKRWSYLLTTISFIAAFFAGLAALIKNLATVINTEFILHAKEYAVMFKFEILIIATILFLIPFIPRVSKFIYATFSEKNYFKHLYIKILFSFALAICVVAFFLNTYYQFLYYKKGMSIRIDIYKNQLISEANSLHNEGKIREAKKVLQECYQIFDSYKCLSKLNENERLIKALDTALWVFDITPECSKFKQTVIKLIENLEGDREFSMELANEIEDSLEHFKEEFRNALVALKARNYKLALELFNRLNIEQPGYLNSHIFANELQRILIQPNMADKLVENTIYVSTVMRSNSVNSIIDQLDIN